MIRITVCDLPAGIENPSSIEVGGDNEVTEKLYDDMNPSRIPEFFAQIGRIEGYMETLNNHWWEGEITLTVEKALHTLEADIRLYDEPEQGIRQALALIEDLAHTLSTSFEARSYRVVFHRKSTVEFSES